VLPPSPATGGLPRDIPQMQKNDAESVETRVVHREGWSREDIRQTVIHSFLAPRFWILGERHDSGTFSRITEHIARIQIGLSGKLSDLKLLRESRIILERPSSNDRIAS
jgi:hypothetical protein